MLTRRSIFIAFLIGLLAAPVILPLIASWGGVVGAQALPWTPTPGSSAAPTATVATRTPTTAATQANATPTPLGTAEVVTPLVPATGGGAPAATATSAGSGAAPSRTSAATPEPGTQPDRCEPNDTLTQPCALPADIDNGDMNFVDDGLDVYSFLLKGGRTYTIRASSSTGIDPQIRLYRADATDTVIASNDDIEAGTTDAEVRIATERDGWYLAAIANVAPGDMRRRIYTVSARSSTAQTPTANATAAADAAQRPVAATQGDLYENNYSPETAATLVWGVPYDLSLVCPTAGQCPAGDHDFFWLPVKSGVPLVALTYDLGPGADPALTIYRPEAGFTDPSTGLVGWRAWAGNDDVVPGFTLRAQVFVTPDWSGYALLVVASSERADPPPLPPAAGAPGRYRLMVGPPALAAVQQVAAAQTDIPAAPTETAPSLPPTGQPAPAPVASAPAGDAREVIKEESVSGMAVVVGEATLFAAAPPSDDDALATYPDGAQVRLLGQTYAGWVKVQPLDSVTPGWMFGPNLRPIVEGGPPARTSSAVGAPSSGAPGVGATAGTSSATPGADQGAPRPQVTPLPAIPTPTLATESPIARAVTVQVCVVAKATDTACARTLEGVKVELIRVSDNQVLFVGLTDRTGEVAPSIQVAPGTAVDVQIGALGIRTALPANGATLPVRVVEASR